MAAVRTKVLCLKSHSLNISDLSWSIDSTTLLSGGYDSTCKTWDIESGTLSGSWETKGFVQCLGWDFVSKLALPVLSTFAAKGY